MSANADDSSILDAFTTLEADAYNCSTPDGYIHAIRRGAPGSRHRVILDGHPTHITIGARSTGPRRDRDSYEELVAAMRAAVTETGIQPELPAEINMIVWQHEGREFRLCAPGSAAALRRARIRRRLSALSPLPLLGAITQPLAGSATAVGIAIAPIPPMHQPDAPPPPVVREMTGDIARPALPYAPGSIPPAAGMPPWTIHPSAPTTPPVEATAKDISPAPALPPLINPKPVDPPPAARIAPPQTPTPTPDVEESADPIEAPTDVPTETPTVEASNDPTVTPEPSPTPTATVSVTELLDSVLHPTRKPGIHHNRHGRHERHPSRGFGRHH